MTHRWISVLFAGILWAITPRVVSATDCNGNGVEDSVDISTGTSEDCQPNGIPDECDAGILYAGTKGGGGPVSSGGAKVFRYTGADQWEEISPSPLWNLSAVMSLAHFDGYLYAAGQVAHAGAWPPNVGQVWRWDGGRDWTQVGGSFTGGVTVVLTYGSSLYAATGAMKLYRYDSPNWTEVGSFPGSGFRSGIVTSVLHGAPEIVLGELNTDGFYRYTPQTGLERVASYYGSCIWDFAEYHSPYDRGRLYAGAHWYFGDGPVYRSALPGTCTSAQLSFGTIRQTYANNWALQAFRGLLYVGGGDGASGPTGANSGRSTA